MFIATAALFNNYSRRSTAKPDTPARQDRHPQSTPFSNRRLTASQAAHFAARIDIRNLNHSHDEMCMEMTKFGWSKQMLKPTQNVATLTLRRGAMIGIAWAAALKDDKIAGKALHAHVTAMDPLRFEHLLCRFVRKHGTPCHEGSLPGHMGFIVFTSMARTSQLPDAARAEAQAA